MKDKFEGKNKDHKPSQDGRPNENQNRDQNKMGPQGRPNENQNRDQNKMGPQGRPNENQNRDQNKMGQEGSGKHQDIHGGQNRGQNENKGMKPHDRNDNNPNKKRKAG